MSYEVCRASTTVLVGLIAIHSDNEFLVPTALGSVMEDPSTVVARITLCEECVVLIRKDDLPFFQTKFDSTMHIHKYMDRQMYGNRGQQALAQDSQLPQTLE